MLAVQRTIVVVRRAGFEHENQLAGATKCAWIPSIHSVPSHRSSRSAAAGSRSWYAPTPVADAVEQRGRGESEVVGDAEPVLDGVEKVVRAVRE